MPHLELNNYCFHYTCVGLHVSGTHQKSSRGEVKAACQKLQKAELTGSERTAPLRPGRVLSGYARTELRHFATAWSFCLPGASRSLFNLMKVFRPEAACLCKHAEFLRNALAVQIICHFQTMTVEHHRPHTVWKTRTQKLNVHLCERPFKAYI